MEKSKIMGKFHMYGDCDEIKKVYHILDISQSRYKTRSECKIKQYSEDSITVSTDYVFSTELEDVSNLLFDIISAKQKIILDLKKIYKLNTLVLFVIHEFNNNKIAKVLNSSIIEFSYLTKSEIHFDYYSYDKLD